jgi:hypothetical protein
MNTINKTVFPPGLASALLLGVTWAAALSAGAVTIPAGSLAARRSGDDLVLVFPTISPNLYTVQTCPDLLQPWTDFQAGIPGDSSVKTVTSTNALPAGNGFYRLLIQSPTKLLLPQSMAFAILGHSCGGIKEQAYVSGFDAASGYPTGNVYLSTTCSTGGRGSHPATFTAWAAATWDLAGNVVSSVALAGGPTVDPVFSATDGYRDTIYNVGTAAYLVVPAPGAPIGVTAVQSGDEFQVAWKPTGVNPAAITSSTLTATPVNSTASILTTTVAGAATTGVIASLQPLTTYEVTVVNTTLGGSSPASASVSVTTSPATVPPSAPTGVAAHWTNLDPAGPTDTLVASWQAAVPGDSPIDQYRITITGSDGGGTFTQTVSGTTLTASFTVDYIPNWSVTVQAHNAFGWGSSSPVVTLGGL